MRTRSRCRSVNGRADQLPYAARAAATARSASAARPRGTVAMTRVRSMGVMTSMVSPSTAGTSSPPTCISQVCGSPGCRASFAIAASCRRTAGRWSQSGPTRVGRRQLAPGRQHAADGSHAVAEHRGGGGLAARTLAGQAQHAGELGLDLDHVASLARLVPRVVGAEPDRADGQLDAGRLRGAGAPRGGDELDDLTGAAGLFEVLVVQPGDALALDVVEGDVHAPGGAG